MRRITVSALLLSALTIAASACGSSSPSATGTTSSVSTAKASSASTVKASSSPTTAATSSGPGSNPGSSFCQEVDQEQTQETKDEAAFTTDTPAELEKFEEQALAALPEFLSQAPSQIKGAVQIVVNADEQVFSALKAANFDFTKLGSNPSFLASFESPAFTNAANAIHAYLTNVCGIKTPVPVTTPTT